MAMPRDVTWPMQFLAYNLSGKHFNPTSCGVIRNKRSKIRRSIVNSTAGCPFWKISKFECRVIKHAPKIILPKLARLQISVKFAQISPMKKPYLHHCPPPTRGLAPGPHLGCASDPRDFLCGALCTLLGRPVASPIKKAGYGSVM